MNFRDLCFLKNPKFRTKLALAQILGVKSSHLGVKKKTLHETELFKTVKKNEVRESVKKNVQNPLKNEFS